MKAGKKTKFFFIIFILFTALSAISLAEEYLWPVPSVSVGSSITQRYKGSSHRGLDISGGGDILATKSGTIIYVYTGCNNSDAASTGINCTWSSCNPNTRNFWESSYGVSTCNHGYGNGVVIRHDDGTCSCYAHMADVCVTKDQEVAQGTKIGTMGSTGNSTGMHLHFELGTGLHQSGSYYNCQGYLINSNPDSTVYVADIRRNLSITSLFGNVTGSATQGVQRFSKGTQISLSTTPETGYNFSKWVISGISNLSETTSNPLSFTMPDNDVYVSAVYSLPFFTHVKRWTADVNPQKNNVSIAGSLTVDSNALFISEPEVKNVVLYVSTDAHVLSTTSSIAQAMMPVINNEPIFAATFSVPTPQKTILDGIRRTQYAFAMTDASQLKSKLIGSPITITPSTRYYYRWSCTINDEDFLSELKAFDTPANTDLSSVMMSPNTNQTITAGSSITFYYEADKNVDFYIHTYKHSNGEDTSKKVTSNSRSGSYTYTFNSVGTFDIYMGAQDLQDANVSQASNRITVTVTSNASALTNVWLTPDTNQTISVGQSITFNYGANKKVDFYLHTYKYSNGDDSSTRVTRSASSGSYTYTFNSAGTFDIYVGAQDLQDVNSSMASNRVTVTVEQAGALSNVWMTPTTEQAITIGTPVTFSFGADQKSVFYFHIYDRNTGEDTSTKVTSSVTTGSYTYTFNSVGSYWIYMGAAHPLGDMSSNGVIVNVYANSDGTKPTVNNAILERGGNAGYSLTCYASDDRNLSVIQIGTWNDVEGIDKAVWQSQPVYGSSASATFYVGTINNIKETFYHTNVYAIDASGNVSDVIRGGDYFIGDGGDLRIDTIYPDGSSAYSTIIYHGDAWGAYEDISAEDEDKYLFDHWESETGTFINAYSKKTTYIIPLGGATISKIYRLNPDFVPVEPGENWIELESIPSYVDLSTCDVEYKHRYQQVGTNSPGDGWIRGNVANSYYQNSGPIQEYLTEQATSDSFVYVGSYYYHYCGASAGVYVNYEPTSKYTTYHNIGDVNQYYVTDSFYDEGGQCYSYKVKWVGGQWADGFATCSDNRSAIYYRKYQYQPRTLVSEYYWTKSSEWSSVHDPNAASVIYRIRLKRYPISLNANGGTFAMESLTKFCTKDLMLPLDVPVRDEHVFTGWNSLANGNGITYLPGQMYDVDEEATLYAQWRLPYTIILPQSLTTIEAEAFAGINAEVIRVPETCTEIKSKAFSNCNELQRIYFESDSTEVALDSFDNCPNLTIIAPLGCQVIRVAKYNDIPYIETTD